MMIRSVIHLRVPLELIRDSPKDRKENFKLVDAIPDAEDFDLLEKVVPLLSKFEVGNLALTRADVSKELPKKINKF